MEIDWDSIVGEKFVTNIGLVTSNGKLGQNIIESKEFGISICAENQAVMSSVSGGYSGKNFDKIKALEELGFKFFKAKKINALLVENAAANFECKLVQEIELGDHLMLIGEAINSTAKEEILPLVLSAGKYRKLNEPVPKRTDEERANIKNTVLKHARK